MSLNKSEHNFLESIPALAGLASASRSISAERGTRLWTQLETQTTQAREERQRGCGVTFFPLVFLELARIIEATTEKKGTAP